MKKVISTALALAMTLSMSVGAFAADNSATLTGGESSSSKDITVKATLQTSPAETEVYSVDVTWTDMTFTYTQPQNKVWNPATHSYTTTDNGAGGWDKNEATVTVTNHSNKEVNVNVSYSAVDSCGVTGVIDVKTKKLASGVGLAYGSADKLVSKLTISGKPAAEGTNDIGTVTVSIAKVS